MYDHVKSSAAGGVNPWPSGRYLNIWVCQLGGGLLGYAQFPGGPAETDGVVITWTTSTIAVWSCSQVVRSIVWMRASMDRARRSSPLGWGQSRPLGRSIYHVGFDIVV